MLDLQKAFDTVDHEILLYKLKAIGMDHKCIKWMSSYLTNRKQLVDVDGTLSSSCKITCGVPQGSILGPLLFLIYVNDMKAAANCKLWLYADDSTLLVSGPNVNTIEATLSMELKSISNWLVDNKLSLHLGKTESILFGNAHQINKCSQLDIVCNNTIIKPTSSVKYLGIVLDQKLSGEHMANNVIKKVSTRIKFLCRKSNYLDVQSAKLLALALVQCQLDYGCCAWYTGLTKKTKGKLQICQNKLIRSVLKLTSRSRITYDHFKFLNWLPVEKRIIHLKLCQLNKIVLGQAPSYMSEGILHTSNSHTHGTRSSHSGIVLPRSRTMMGKNSFLFTSIKEWNNLPLHVQSVNSVNVFKKDSKIFLFNELQLNYSNDFVQF